MQPIKDLGATLERIRQAHVGAGPARPGFGAEEGLGEEIRQLGGAFDGERAGRRGKALVPQQGDGLARALCYRRLTQG
jgi:hypothetical protein